MVCRSLLLKTYSMICEMRPDLSYLPCPISLPHHEVLILQLYP